MAALKYVTSVARKRIELNSVVALLGLAENIVSQTERYQKSEIARAFSVSILNGNLDDRYAVVKGLLNQALAELTAVNRYYPIKVVAGKPDDPATTIPETLTKTDPTNTLAADIDTSAIGEDYFEIGDVVLLENFTGDNGEQAITAVAATNVTCGAAGFSAEANDADAIITLIRRDNP